MTISDTARANLLNLLGLTESTDSNVDLFKRAVDDALIVPPVAGASTGTNYELYLQGL